MSGEKINFLKTNVFTIAKELGMLQIHFICY